MKIQDFCNILNADFYTGVPDSQLKALCNYLMKEYGIDSQRHIIAANEGNCVAIASGYYLSTGKIPVVYMQNSGEGNIINPVASLTNEKVYKIPMIFIIGWRGEPGIHDEPQHIYQGEVTLKLLEDMGIESYVVGTDTSVEDLKSQMEQFSTLLNEGKSVAYVIRKGALEYSEKVNYSNDFKMVRETVIEHIVKYSDRDPIVSTTGKISRELFEVRERNNMGHKYDFLTVGSMGHSSSIALGIAANKNNTKVWCIDGDGASIMHMGAMAVIGNNSLKNFIHIVVNNGAHESVGGMPTVANTIDITAIAKACGYKYAVCVDNYDDLDEQLSILKSREGLSLIEVKCALGSRDDLGRPTTTALENRQEFMNYMSTI